jgi:hypothetical protein
MARTTTKAKKAPPAPTANMPEEKSVKAHELVLSPTIQSAAGIQAWSKFAGDADLVELVVDLREQVKQVQSGDMGGVEAMLYGQAMTLQTIFTNLARKAQAQEYLKQFQVNLSLALKAQAQCRATLEALAEIKNPRPVAFVKQANISGGHQQVNNGMQPVQQAESTQGGGGIESLPSPEAETARSPTQTIYSHGADIQAAWPGPIAGSRTAITDPRGGTPSSAPHTRLP